MRTLFFLLSFLFFSAASAAISYPHIQESKGKIQWLREKIDIANKVPVRKEHKVAVNRKTKIKDEALLQTLEDGEISLQLNEGSELTIYPFSEVELPSIHWKNGVIGEIRLRQGKIRYTCKKNCELKIITALHESVLPVGEYVLDYDKGSPKIEMTVIEGETVFRGLENEISVTLRAAQQAQFDGKYAEDGVVLYDVLLRGKKVAQGQLSEIKKLTEKELAQFKKKAKSTAQKKAEAAANAIADGELPKISGQICQKPFAKLDECAWICQNNPKGARNCDYERGAQCQRQRCNANGEWADSTVLPTSEAKCSSQITISKCDY